MGTKAGTITTKTWTAYNDDEPLAVCAVLDDKKCTEFDQYWIVSAQVLDSIDLLKNSDSKKKGLRVRIGLPNQLSTDERHHRLRITSARLLGGISMEKAQLWMLRWARLDKMAIEKSARRTLKLGHIEV